MQFSQNKITIVGRAGKDAEVKTLQNRTDVCNFSVATTRSFKKNGDQDWTKVTTWHNVKMFGKSARMAGMIRKGDNVIVIGSVEQRSWDDKNGQKKYITEISAEFFGVLKDYSKDDSGFQDSDQSQNGGYQESGESY